MEDFHQSKQRSGLVVSPIGGVNEFGLNMTLYKSGSSSILVDAGSMISNIQDHGIDAVIPNLDYVIEKADQLLGYFITHGHEDHIGSLPFLYEKLPKPIFATPWTAEVILNRFQRWKRVPPAIEIVMPNELIQLGPFAVRTVHMTHSIPDAISLHIEAENRSAFHSSDFKIDMTPVGSLPFDIKALEEVAPVDLLVVDSTNASSRGRCPSENETVDPIRRLMNQSQGAFFVTTFASNYWRLHSVAESCRKLNKKLFISGRGMQNSFEFAKKLKFSDFSDIIIDPKKIKDTPRHKLVVLVSGSQCEQMSSLKMISLGKHKFISVQTGDEFLFSSRVIPGNEKSVIETCDDLSRQGAKIYTERDVSKVHVSGHGYWEDIKQLIEILKPACCLPVHGTHSLILSNAKRIKEETHSEVVVANNGDDIVVSESGAFRSHQSSPEPWMIDENSLGPIPPAALSERKKMGRRGLIIASGVFSEEKMQWMAPPTLKLLGIALPGENDSWVNSLIDKVTNLSFRSQASTRKNVSDLKVLIEKKLRTEINNHAKDLFQRNIPVISNIFVLRSKSVKRNRN